MTGGLQAAFILIFISIISFLTFNRGGFFAFEAMPAAAAILVMFLVVWFLVKSISERGMAILGATALWLAVWILSLSRAAHIGLAFEELLRNAMYIGSFLLIYLGNREEKFRLLAVVLLLVIGVCEALSGLGTAYGTFDFASAYNAELRRVMGTMQYPNALAAYLSMLFILGLYLYSALSQRWLKAVTAAANYLLFTGILSAQSRGAILALLLILAPALAFWPRNSRRQVLFHSLFTVGVAFAVAKWTVNFSGAVSSGQQWLGLGAGVAITILLVFLKFSLNWQEQGEKYSRILVFTGTVTVLLIGAYFLLRSGGLLERLTNINFQDQNVQERLVFYQDGLKMLKDYPLTGAGGGGWRTLFEKYQSYRYVSRETHSYPLKVLVETGIIGFSAYLLVFGGFFALLFRQWWRAKALPPLAWAGMWAVLLVTLHSFIDFTLSLSAITVTMWIIMALTLAELEEKEPLQPKSQGLSWAGVAITLVLIIFAAKISLGERYYRTAQQAFQAQDLSAAAAKIQQAIAYNSWKAEYYREQFVILLALAQQQNNPSYFAEAVKSVRKAVELDPYSANNVLNYGKALLLEGQIEQGLSELEKLTTLAPYDIRTWEVLTEAYHNVAQYYQQQGETAKAEAYRAKMQEVPRRMEKVWQQVPEKYKRMWIAWPKLEVTDYMKKLLVN
ncbi:O-Antigen ligase [Carboxydocella sporoproducens DSM 16521]|uniref:O-Antigen ligase n=2 Tax=Carboxydocella TaxID=178898 RepID=A0A1T4P0W1_9FIRM|nr:MULTISPECIES: O-antigen ligase family protein [Carboxydocella]AVX19591.1 O-Antigen ligase [Carboxydocella thermautotrophica]AVX30006.1 O-Antigen ligase [Carboxydocella thermautotrophica]SJZ85145.1 O-Antigen ligase [Carboxydocella sporoproducens DSM 16521]